MKSYSSKNKSCCCRKKKGKIEINFRGAGLSHILDRGAASDSVSIRTRRRLPWLRDIPIKRDVRRTRRQSERKWFSSLLFWKMAWLYSPPSECWYKSTFFKFLLSLNWNELLAETLSSFFYLLPPFEITLSLQLSGSIRNTNGSGKREEFKEHRDLNMN